MTHDHEIEFPNGRGYTPCTKEYFDKMNEAADMRDECDGNINDLSPEDYQKYCTIQNDLMDMQLNGHIGKSVRY